MLKKHVRGALAAALLLGLVGCATRFQGDAEFPGGALGCYHQCEKIKMDMATFVYVGAYSTACACKPKTAGATSATSSATSSSSGAEGAVVAATVGVELQRRALAAQRQQLNAAPIIVH